MPSRLEIHRLYDDYYTHSVAESAVSRIHRLLNKLLGSEHERRNLWALHTGDLVPGRLLEVGFGDGQRLRYFKQRGWEVEGQEFDPIAIRNARADGFKVHEGDLEALNLPAESFDAVVGSHVLEHVYDPVSFLAEACRVTKSGGQVVMVTPNGQSYGHGRFKRHWRGLEVPRHLHIFSPVSLARLAEGLNVTRYVICTTPINATNFLIPSIKASRKMAKRGAQNSLSVKLDTVLHLLLARSNFSRDPGCGEELILRATV